MQGLASIMLCVFGLIIEIVSLFVEGNRGLIFTAVGLIFIALGWVAYAIEEETNNELC